MRAYRRQVIEAVAFESNGFSATTEILLRAAHQGYTVAEVPMVLKSRLIGVSKMKVAYTVRTHLGLMAQALWWRLFNSRSAIVLAKNTTGN
jgi:hypothetical protein